MSVWKQSLRKVEKFISKLLRGKFLFKGHYFWCDGHPKLCAACIRLRTYLKNGSIPSFTVIYSHNGKFIHHNKDLLVVRLSEEGKETLNRFLEANL